MVLDFAFGKGKILLILSSVRNLLQVDVQNCNDFTAKGKRSKDPKMKKYLAINISGWSLLIESGKIEVDIIFKGNLENSIEVFFF